ncbi:hypothetical protein BC835DRAFT_1309757 [Cytidiella melzeri]|nr:hypothetical protein BC835DRAFT_1309757 [Cytidiella melzeri]
MSEAKSAPEAAENAQHQSGKGKAQQENEKGKGRLRGRPSDSPEMRLSKTVTWVLRHGAAQESLALRPDGYARVQDLLKLPKLKGLDFPTLEKLVQDDNKNRFNLLREPDVEDIGNPTPVWWIRANQGHSLKSVEVEVAPIKSLSNIPSGIAVHGTTTKAWTEISVSSSYLLLVMRLSLVTSERQGLSKMKRNHIHLAQGLPSTGVTSGMRRESAVFIYIDVEKALQAGLHFYLSSNGVVLSDGDKRGFIHPQFFQRVVNAKGETLMDTQNSTDTVPVDAPPSSDTTVVELADKAENLSL